MSTITLYTNPQSRARIVRWMLEEIGEPYDVKVLPFGSPMKSPEYLALNPMGKVPTLVHRSTVITEVAAICSFLAEQYPHRSLAPMVDDPARGTYYRWLFFIAGPLEMATSAKAFHWPIDDKAAMAAGCGRIDDTLNVTEQVLAKQPYLCGDKFTTADLLMSSYLGWEMMMKVIEPRQVFVDYVARCEAREAAKRASRLDDALMEEAKVG